MMMVPTKILPLVTTSLLSWGTKIRMGMELFRAPKAKAGDESVAQFIEEHYGAEAVDYLAEPLLSGIYGGDPKTLSVKSVLPRFVDLANKYGSLTRGVLAERAKAPKNPNPAPLFRTLKGGLGQLVDAVTAAIGGKAEVRQARAQAVERTVNGFRIKLNGDWLEADRLVMACEAHSGASLLQGVDARIGELLGAVPYSSSMTVALGFDAADFARLPVGFGFLVPKKERRRLVACTWVGTKFSHRVPEGKIVARCFLGGMDDAGILNESDDAIVAAVTRNSTKSPASPRSPNLAASPAGRAPWRSIPWGTESETRNLETRVAAIPGLYLAGNAYQGIGIPDCIRMGRAAGEKILAG